MALRAGYQGFKKLLPGLKLFRPGCLGIDNSELSKTFFPRSEQAALGAVNMFNNTATTDTVSGIVCTVNDDKTVTASGTYSGGTYAQFTLGRVSVKAGQILKGCPSGGGTSTYQLILFNSAQTARLAADLGEGAVVSADDPNALLAIYFHASVTDKVFKPQICLSMDTPYAPYAMTNPELTDRIFNKEIILTSGDDLNDVVETGIYRIYETPTNAPENVSYATLIVHKVGSTVSEQIIIRAGSIYSRISGSNPRQWYAWYKFTGTSLS